MKKGLSAARNEGSYALTSRPQQPGGAEAMIRGDVPRGKCTLVNSEGVAMDEIEVMHLTFVFRSGAEKWLAESFWLLPKDHASVVEVVNTASQRFIEEAKAFIDLNKPFTFKADGERYVLYGPLAMKMRHHLNAVAGGMKPAFNFGPAVEVRFAPGEGFFNG